MNKLVLAFLGFFLAMLSSAAADGPGPNPYGVFTPVQGGIGYTGCLIMPLNVSGGCKGPGTFNVGQLYIGGVAVNGSVVPYLSNATGAAGGLVAFGGNGGTPSALLLTNATGLPLSTGVTGILGVANGGSGAATFTAGLPLLGNGTGAFAQGTLSGNTTKLATVSGTLTAGHCLQLDSSLNVVDAGGVCTTGGGGGTVSAGSAGNLAYYGSSGTAVTGLANGTASQVLLGGSTPSWGSVNLSTMASGVLQAAQSPAHTGDVTNSAGSLALTIANGAVTNAKMAAGAALANLTYTPANIANNLSDLASISAARSNLGLGALATLNSVSLTSQVTGVLQAAQFPSLTGDVNVSSGTLSTAVVSVGGKSVSLGGSLSTTGGFNLTVALSGNTSLTFPTSGTVTALGNTTTGSGNIVLSTSPTLSSPNLGTPTSLTLTNATGLPSTSITGLGTGVGSALAATPTGTGVFVLASAPTLAGLTVTGALNATGLVTNADLANPSMTINGVSCTLGTGCSITATAASITVGSTTIVSGTGGSFLYNNSGVLANAASTGSGNVVLATSPTLTNANLGTPSTINLANATNIPTGSLVGSTLPSSIVNSSLTSVGTLTGLTVSSTIAAPNGLGAVSSGNGGAYIYPGGASNPGYIQFNNPAGTRVGYMGFQSPSNFLQLETEAGYLGYHMNGTLAVDSQIGIGTTSPNTFLDLRSNLTVSTYLADFLEAGLPDTGAVSLFLGKSLSNYLSTSLYYTYNATTPINSMASIGLYGNSYALNVMGNGNVGIGTTTPGQLLDVNGTIRASQANNASIQSYNPAAGTDQKTAEISQYDTTGTVHFRFDNDAYTASNDFMAVNRQTGSYLVSKVSFPSGNVLIANTISTNSGTGNGLSLVNNQINTIGNGEIVLNWNGVANAVVSIADGSTNRKFSFNPNGNSYFNGGGYVGIGTTSPNQELDVNGTVRSSQANNSNFQLYNSASGANQKIAEMVQYDTSGMLSFRFINDAYNAASDFMDVYRQAGSYLVSTVSFPNGNVSINGNILNSSGIVGFNRGGTGSTSQDLYNRERKTLLVTDFGASGSSTTTTGSGNSGTSAITVASASSFAVGQGVRIMGAGAANNASNVSGLSGAVVGTGGSHTIQYQLLSLDYNGGIASPVSVTVSSTPNPITYSGQTFYNSTQNFVRLSLTQGSGSSGYLVCRKVDSGAMVPYSIGFGSIYEDHGIGWITNDGSNTWLGPDYLSSCSGSARNWYVGTITGISSNTLTLSANLQATVSGATVYHDDTYAFNQAQLQGIAEGGALIDAPCGNYNISASVYFTGNYTGFSGRGMCTAIVSYGTGYDFYNANTNIPAQQRGNFVQNMYVIDRNKSTGYTIWSQNGYNFTYQNLQVDFPPFGFMFLDSNTVNTNNVDVNSGPRAYGGIGFVMMSDVTTTAGPTYTSNYSCCLNAYNHYIHGNAWYVGGPSSIGGQDKQGYLFDGNVATVYAFGLAASDIEGTDMNIINDIANNTVPPYYLTFYSESCEFPTNRCINIKSNASDIYITDSTNTAAQNANTNIVADSTVSRLKIIGGKIANAGCRGLDWGGYQLTLIGVDIGNNSTPSAGGTTGSCDGVIIESTARQSTISANNIGDPFNATVQRNPVVVVPGADYFTITGNTFLGNVTNCVSNGAGTSTAKVVAPNGGSC